MRARTGSYHARQLAVLIYTVGAGIVHEEDSLSDEGESDMRIAQDMVHALQGPQLFSEGITGSV